MPLISSPIPTCIPSIFFFFNDTATTEIYTLSLHDALPIPPLVGAARVPSAVDPLRCSAGCLALRVTFLRRLFASGIARASTLEQGLVCSDRAAVAIPAC